MDNGLTVLLADANHGDAALIHSYIDIENPGSTIIRVATLHDTVEQLKQSKFDVVLLELKLEDSEGIQTAASICQFVEANRPRPPVVVLSELSDQRTIDGVIALCADDYLLKSQLDSRCLAHAIRVAIQRHTRQLTKHGHPELQDALDALRRLNRSGINCDLYDRGSGCDSASDAPCPIQDMQFFLAHLATSSRATEVALGELTGRVQVLTNRVTQLSRDTSEINRETILNSAFRNAREDSVQTRQQLMGALGSIWFLLLFLAVIAGGSVAVALYCYWLLRGA